MIDLKNIQPLKRLKILLLGDSCTDRYNIGTVDRLSPEAPVPVLKIDETYDVRGMAANVNDNLRALNADVDFITNDQEIIKTRYIDKRSGQHMLRVDTEPDVIPWDGQVIHPIDTYDAIVISDYNKGFLSYKNIEDVISKATGPVFIDTKKTDLLRFSAAHVYVKINELEYKNLVSTPSNLIVTLGDRGAMLYRNSSTTETIFEIIPAEVMDVCGCGDTFLSAVSYQYLQTNNIDSAIIFANAAASITVRHRGNYAPSFYEILNS